VNSWINLNALWKIVVIGLLAGAGLPALFAIGLKVLASGVRTTDAETAAASSPDLRAKLSAGFCFAAVLAGMGWGVYSIVHSS
jgi:hypothetical protein